MTPARALHRYASDQTARCQSRVFGACIVKLYVGNMSFSTTEETLEGLFSNYGEVQEVTIITDRDTGRPRGFGFVTMNDEGAKAAIEERTSTPATVPVEMTSEFMVNSKK